MLLDTASLYFRAFHALPASMTDPQGRPVNALRGLADFIATLATQYRPSHLIACWDCDWRPAWRVAAVPSYKTHRLADPSGPGSATSSDSHPANVTSRAKEIVAVDSWGDRELDEQTPDDLEQQVPRIVAMLRLAGIPILGCAAHEADDVIGTLAATAPMPGCVVTGDRDLFQVIDDARGVRVVYLTRGVAKHAVVDATALEQRYGVSPGQYADFALLRGDSSDGLPGVAGIGEKTAASLLRGFGSVTEVMAAVEDPSAPLPAAQRNKLRAGRAYVEAAGPVVRVVRDLVNPFGWDELRLTAAPPEAEWQQFVADTALGSAGERLLRALAPLRA